MITLPKVVAIRSRYAVGDITQRATAAMFGVSQATVHRIVTRRTWK